MNKPNHSDCTEMAFSLYLRFRGIAEPLAAMRTYLGMASASEDAVLSFSDKLQRAFNWHFYNNNGLIRDSPWIPGRRTSEKRFDDLLTRVTKDLQRWERQADGEVLEALLETTGRIMHHIQDMSTPAHVVPVYHDPLFKDHYESYIEQYARKIEAHLQDGDAPGPAGDRLKVFVRRDEISAAIAEHSRGSLQDSLKSLYDGSAQDTLTLLRDGAVTIYCNGEPGRFSLEQFWQPNDGNKKTGSDIFWLQKSAEDFGSFGPLGNNFGKMIFSVNRESGGEPVETLYEGNPDEYLRVYRQLLKKTLLDSIVVLDIVAGFSSVFSDERSAEIALSWN